MICPLCETESPDDLPECTGCGKELFAQLEPEQTVELIDGLEETSRAPLASAFGSVSFMVELEETAVARRDLAIAEEPMTAVESTQLQSDPSAPLFWSAGAPDLDLGRELDDGARTAAPVETGLCPWCGAAATGPLCDACGRRRSRYTSARVPAAGKTAQDSGELLVCPACFSRVPPGPRCESCHVPFTPREAL